MKPGIRTTEFWLTLISVVLIDTGSIPVPDKYKAISTALATIGYALSRGLAKLGANKVVTPVTQVTGK
jgi:hypothetical protein